MAGTPRPTTVSTQLHTIATRAREAPERVFTTLAHHLDMDLLRAAYRRTRKEGAPGVDGQTAEDSVEDLESHLQSLLNRLKAGTSVAPPVKRAYVPKDERGASRPIGIPTCEEKVLQRAVAMTLEAVYEQAFLDCSDGFRPGRAAQQALAALWGQVRQRHGGWGIKVDMHRYVDTVDHGHLRRFLDQRVRDGVMRRMIDKWLKAGVLEAGCVTHADTGVPQGSGVAPILSNVFLHGVLARGFEHEVKPRLSGEASLYRVADDIAIVGASEQDARRLMAVWPKRLGQYDLTRHPDKTRVIRFPRPPSRTAGRRQTWGWPGTFALLGFTPYWGRSRQGNWVVKRKTVTGRLSRALKRSNIWCLRHRHAKVAWQYQQLVRKLRGHDAYYGIIGNERGLKSFHRGVGRRWRQGLNRRSQRRTRNWGRFQRLLERYPLPDARIARATSGT